MTQQTLAGRDADGLAGLSDDRHPPARTRVAPTTHCAVTHGGLGSTRQRATGYDVRRGQRHDRLAAHEHARKGRGRLRRPCVHAGHDGAEMNNGSRHSQMIVSAPALMSVEGPTMLMIAPLPLEMVMPVSLTEIMAPVVVLIRMPPVGPGTSLIVRLFCSGV